MVRGLARETNLFREGVSRYTRKKNLDNKKGIICIPELHNVRLGQDALHGPSGKLAAVVLHFGSNNGTTLGDELRPPVESTSAALGTAVELVEGLDGDQLVLAADGVLLDGIDLGTDNQVDRLLLVGGEIESPVLVSLAGRRIGVIGGVVEGVSVGHLNLGRVVLGHDLVGKVVVDVGGLLGEGRGLVDDVLATVGSLQGSVGGVLVDGHHIQVGVVTLVKEDLVALAHDDNVPGVDRASRAHKHGENAVGGEDGSLVLLGVLLDDRVRGGGDVVGGTVNSREFPLSTLDRLLVVGAVVVVKETVVVQVLTIVSIKVELGQAVEVDLLEKLPVGLDVDAGITVASRLVVVLPAEATSTTGTSTTSSTALVAIALSATGGTLELASSSTAGITTAAALASATGENGTTTIS